MKYLRAFVQWAKSHVPIVAAAAVALIAIVGLVMVESRGEEFVLRMKEGESQIRKIQAFLQTSIVYPSEDPNEEPERKQGAVNRKAIEELKSINERLAREAQGINELTVQLNIYRHFEMIENLFPETTDALKPFDARFAYRDSFVEMLGPYSADAELPRLNAGLPPSPEELQMVTAEATRRFLTDTFPFEANPSVENLSDQQFQQMKLRVQQRVIESLQKRAQSIHVYAQTDIVGSGFPFEVLPWSTSDQRAPMDVIWEGQMGLWIQQDIAAAIALANRVDDPRANVLSAPVKRLLQIRVHPGYVGIDNAGAMVERLSRDERKRRSAALSDADKAAGNVPSADKRLPDDFAKAPTGRRSNTIYDVRHAYLTVVADYTRLPQLFDAISRVNLMTVLDVQIRDVDEYEAYRQGFVYGSGDAVQVDLVIETIWLRDWTSKLMPPEVRQRLGIELPEDQEAAEGASS